MREYDTSCKDDPYFKPSLSANLRDLEQELGFQLFNRTGKRLELNDSGRYYAKRVQEALGILEEAQKQPAIMLTPENV